jgi:hypothetical protein
MVVHMDVRAGETPVASSVCGETKEDASHKYPLGVNWVYRNGVVVEPLVAEEIWC